MFFSFICSFPARNRFPAEVAGITIEGRSRTGAPGQDKIITELELACNGMLFSLGGETPPIIYSQDGLEHRAIPVDYRVTASGIDITFSRELGISFYTAKTRPDNMIVSISAGDPASIKYITLPVQALNGAEISSFEGVPVISVESEQHGSHYLTLPEGAFYDTGGTLVLYPSEDTFADLIFERSAGSGLDAFTYWFSGNSSLISEGELNNKISAYLASSSKAMIGERFDASGTWTSATGLKEFNEKAMVAVISEQIGTSSYVQTKRRLDPAAEKNSKTLGIISSPLFGNIVNICWRYEKDQEESARELTERAENGDYSIFQEEDLYKAVLSEKIRQAYRRAAFNDRRNRQRTN